MAGKTAGECQEGNRVDGRSHLLSVIMAAIVTKAERRR